MNLFATLFELSLISVPIYFEYCYPWQTALVLSPIIALLMIRSRGNQTKFFSKKTMKAAIYDLSAPKGFRVLEDYPIQTFSNDQMLVKVYSSAINPVDYKVVTPKIPVLRWLIPHTVGRDFAGVIVEIGKNVRKFKVGDEVFGKAKGGCLQEFTVVSENDIAKKPPHLDWLQAGGLSLVGLTSLQALSRCEIKKNERVLIIGASGACGTLGVIIAKKFGCHVTGVCSSANANKVRALGAEKVLAYDKSDYLQDIAGEKFDVIYDTVTSPEDADMKKVFYPYLKENTGKYVAINSKQPLDFIKGILKLKSGRNRFVLTSWTTVELEQLASLVDSAQAETIIDSVYDLTQSGVEEAFAKQKSRRAKGKLIFRVFKN